MEDIKKAIAALESLIRAHHIRINAYSSLCEMTSQEEIKSFCTRCIEYSKQVIKNLSAWRSAYGGFARSSDVPVGGNMWLWIRLFLSFNPERIMIDRCDQLERELQTMYKLAMPLIPSSVVGDLQLQVKALGRARVTPWEFTERRQTVGSFATK